MNNLEPEKIIPIIQPQGLLSTFLKGFEPREQQQMMLRNVIDAYNEGKIVLIEAGTGTGKSIAYLIPAILWAMQRKERTVISTNTINLQEQLIEKDIPLLLRALNVNLKAVLVKGMNNYICLRKLHDALGEAALLPQEEAAELHNIDSFQQSRKKGSRSDLPFVPSSATWERAGAEPDTCNMNKCPYYQQCHFFKARREAQDAQLLVVNHHLLFADLSKRAQTGKYEETVILPPYSRVILDEAHNIEDVATDFLAARITRADISKLLARLASDRQSDSHGKLPMLKKKITDHYGRKREHANPSVASILSRLTIQLPGEKRDLLQIASDAFHLFQEFMQFVSPKQEEIDSKLRIRPSHRTTPLWKEEVTSKATQLLEGFKKYAVSLRGLELDIQNLKDEKLDGATESIRFEINALCNRFGDIISCLQTFIADEENPERVRWIESETRKSFPNVNLIEADLDISKKLVDALFAQFPTIVLCSATMTTDQKFDFIKRRLGLTKELLSERIITEHIYDSPFNYQQQALLVIPSDIPNPDHPNFIAEACKNIWDCVQASRGNAFVLFTSYQMLISCHSQLSQKLKEARYHVLKQGEDSRNALLKRFKETDRSVLFGTDSFWEGVDVMGEALRCVIIVKLPFKVPSEPLVQARAEIIESKGGSSFLEYSVPNAIVKFKQGFGRLIRHKQDRGCIVCLDSRLITKGYGKLFLNSLPKCDIRFEPREKITQVLEEFYRKTYVAMLQKR